VAGHVDIGKKAGIKTIGMKSFRVRPINKDDKKWVGELLKEWWAGPLIVTRGKVHQADELPGFTAEHDGKPVGLITYEIAGDRCEIASMNSLMEGKGVGSALIDAVKKSATKAGCKSLWLIASNDNTKALRFYQKRGFRMVAVYPGAIEQTRKLKSEIPLTGNDGIPIKDEIEMELFL
jgi:N-acetylglutamate synthase-like GNAT family acetyltransferase